MNLGGGMNRSYARALRLGGAATAVVTTIVLAVPSVASAGSSPSAIAQRLGCTDLPVSAVRATPDGGQIYDFKTTDGQLISQPVPPSGFQPAGASAAQLTEYGFPQRPPGAADLDAWNHAMAAYHTTQSPGVCWNAAPPQSDGPVNLQVVSNNADTSANWAGYATGIASPDSFTQVQTDYGQPARNASCSNSYESAWAGMGGWRHRADGSWGLIQDGTELDPTGIPFAWYEWIGGNSSGGKIGVAEQPMGLGISPGDEVFAQTTWGGNTTFFVEDVSTGVGQTELVPLSSAFYDGRNAEWIIEAPTVNNSIATLQNFNAIGFRNLQSRTATGRVLHITDTSSTLINMTNGSGQVKAATHGAYGTNGNEFNSYYQQCN